MDAKSPIQHGGPSSLRGVLVIAGVAMGIWSLAQCGRGGTGEDEKVKTLGRIEVTARLLDCPDPFPDLGAYRYTYVVPYEVLEVHRQDPEGRYALKRGDRIFVGHYQPRLPRSKIQDSDWGPSPLGGNLTRFAAGDVHRMALDYELAALAPSGAIDYCFPAETNRFFAVWTNPAGP
jgi:hypothetical protein